MKPKRIIIDTDIALGQRHRDVDDGLAIVMAAGSPDLTIEAITLTYGNDSLDNVKQSMNRLATQMEGFSIQAVRGAGSASDLGKKSEATEKIIQTLNEDKATIVAIGPLTNIASALMLEPIIAERIEEIVMVAGRQPGQRFLTGNHDKSHPDLNFERDPEALKFLISSKVPITLAPFEVSSKVWVTRDVLEKVTQNDTALSKYLVEHCSRWLEFWGNTFSTPLLKVEAFNPFDTLAIAWLTDRDLLSWSPVEIAVEIDNYDLTDTVMQGTGSPAKPYLHARRKETANTYLDKQSGNEPLGQNLSSNNSDVEPHKKPEYIYIYDVQREAFLNRLIKRLK